MLVPDNSAIVVCGGRGCERATSSGRGNWIRRPYFRLVARLKSFYEDGSAIRSTCSVGWVFL